MPPTTRYAKHGDLNLAYQVAGEGEVDIVMVPSFVSHIDLLWGDPTIKAWLDRLQGFARLVLFDKAGTGCSDPVSSVPTLEERADEIEAVMDAAGVERAVMFGTSEGGPSSIFFGATRPERVSALVLFGTFPTALPLMGGAAAGEELARRGHEPQYIPNAQQLNRLTEFRDAVNDSWGEGKALKLLLPSWERAQLALLERLSASPGMARATFESAAQLDVSDLLPSVRVPTLIVHARDDLVPIQMGRLLADRIPGAAMLEVEGNDHAPWLSDPDGVAAEIERFLTGSRRQRQPNRALATVLFTDIVSSTARAAELGDARWRAVLERHDEITRREVAAAGGKVVKSTGDGVLATFDGPASAIRCAEELAQALDAIGVHTRAGIHTGECELIGDDVGGLAVHIAARVNALAEPGELLVSRTVRDLVVGSGIRFRERGSHDLKGVPGSWELLAVVPQGAADSEPGEDVSTMPTPAPREAMGTRDRIAATTARRTPGVARAFARRHRGD